MHKTSIITLVLFISSICLQAQSVAGQAAGKAPSPNTIEGCLQSSNGQYTLTDNSGVVHQLSGAATKLGHHVGHEVELTGKPGVRTIDTTNTMGAGSSTAVEQPVFDVKSVKHIAAACKSTGQ
jgi:hypothetical protein